MAKLFDEFQSRSFCVLLFKLSFFSVRQGLAMQCYNCIDCKDPFDAKKYNSSKIDCTGSCLKLKTKDSKFLSALFIDFICEKNKLNQVIPLFCPQVSSFIPCTNVFYSILRKALNSFMQSDFYHRLLKRE